MSGRGGRTLSILMEPLSNPAVFEEARRWTKEHFGGIELEDMLALQNILSGVGGFHPPVETEGALRSLQTALSIAPPVHAGLDAEGLARWRQSLAQGAASIKSGLTAAHYHRQRVRAVEQEVERIAVDNESQLRANEGGTMGFSCPPLVFEYHAFLFARRRTLEYTAVTIGSFFRKECHRIKALSTAIHDAEPEELRDRVRSRLQSELPRLRLSDAGYRDERDRVAHWDAVDAGTFNIGAWPGGDIRTTIVGGAEELEFGVVEPTRLSLALRVRLEDVEQFVLGCFVDLGLLDEDRVPNRVPNSAETS